jgi:hypothetical protein
MLAQMTACSEAQMPGIASRQDAMRSTQPAFLLDGPYPRMTPNPSIEGMPKRLRLSVTPHVKR